MEERSLPSMMLTKSNYDNLIIKMKALLGAQDVWDVVKRGHKEQNDVTLSQAQRDALKDLRNREKKAVFLIFQTVDEYGFEKISSATTAKEASDKLQTLTGEFELLYMEEPQSIFDYFS